MRPCEPTKPSSSRVSGRAHTHPIWPIWQATATPHRQRHAGKESPSSLSRACEAWRAAPGWVCWALGGGPGLLFGSARGNGGGRPGRLPRMAESQTTSALNVSLTPWSPTWESGTHHAPQPLLPALPPTLSVPPVLPVARSLWKLLGISCPSASKLLWHSGRRALRHPWEQRKPQLPAFPLPLSSGPFPRSLALPRGPSRKRENVRVYETPVARPLTRAARGPWPAAAPLPARPIGCAARRRRPSQPGITKSTNWLWGSVGGMQSPRPVLCCHFKGVVGPVELASRLGPRSQLAAPASTLSTVSCRSHGQRRVECRYLGTWET